MRDLIEEAGRLLYGDKWVSAMARDLAIARRTVAYWARGKYSPQPAHWEALQALVRMRQSAYADLIRRLEEAANRGASQ